MLELQNIKKSFAFASEAILKGINLTLPQGEFCIILGSNGSGKSTLLRCISGEHKVDEGSITMGRVASVSQDINKTTIAEMTMLENIILSQMSNRPANFKLYHQQRSEVMAMVSKLNLGLEAFIDKPLGLLSGGQRQIIATLMAFSSNPELLLLDEHTSALDPKMQKFLLEYTKENITKNNITALMVTHNLEDALNYGDSLIMLDKGRIIFTADFQQKSKLTLAQLHKLFQNCEGYNG